jgi:hypothetical protein
VPRDKKESGSLGGASGNFGVGFNISTSMSSVVS